MGRQQVVQPTAEPVTLGGRRFVPVMEGTLEHDLHFIELYAKAGLGELTLRDNESPEEFAQRILRELAASGLVLEILGTLLVPEDVGADKWTPEEAARTSRFMAALRGDEDKAKVKAMVQGLVMDFFARGMVSFFRSQRSSDGAHPGQPGAAVPTLTRGVTGAT